jgi:hypothetical protein
MRLIKTNFTKKKFMKKYYDKSLDDTLTSIPTLSWIPWIGENYLINPFPKTLIISESHYEWAQEEDDEMSASDYLSDKNFTRDFFESRGLNFLNESTFDVKLIRNFEKTILNSASPSSEQKQKLWFSSAYYTFVQRAMKTVKERPNSNDFSIGWKNFIEVVKVLKPDVCIFLGVTSINNIYSANKTWENEKIIVPNINKHNIINGAHPRTVSIEIGGKSIKLIALKHPSMGYTWEDWVDFLKDELAK